MDFGLRIENI